MTQNEPTTFTTRFLTAITVYVLMHAYAWVLIRGGVGVKWIVGSTMAYVAALLIVAVMKY